MPHRKLHAVVVVLGDVGRSPRMQYHAASLLEAGHHVTLVGYQGEDLVPLLKQFPLEQLTIVRFTVPSPKWINKVRPLYFLWRIISLALWLLWALIMRVPNHPPVDCVLVQNPPALPLLFVSALFCWIQKVFYRRKRPALIIDWHNLGFSMLRIGRFRQLAKAYEKFMAPFADGNLTVTHAMKEYLISDMNIEPSKINVVYDCAPAMFQALDLSRQHEILMRLDQCLTSACPKSWYASKIPEKQTLFTEEYASKQYRPRPGRPALVVSSTSWTEDEDFGLLLDALVTLDARIATEQSSLKVMVVVTGKGPQKNFYQRKISELSLSSIAIQTMWLEPSDYPRLLACADLGVSLHTSTSGLDLPMKVLDMFGCQVPVCAVNFACLSELVDDKVNGRIFETSGQLADVLWTLLSPLMTTSLESTPACHEFGDLARYSKALQNRPRWSENWKCNAWPVIQEATEHLQ